MREKCAKGFGKTDLEIIVFIVKAEVVFNSDVAECMGMSFSGAQKALQGLIDAGLVTRVVQKRQLLSAAVNSRNVTENRRAS